MSMFEQATRLKLRFSTDRGALMVEQLWDLPLLSKSGFDLNTVAKTVHAELKNLDEENFVEQTKDPRKEVLNVAMDIVKHVIATKQAENQGRIDKAAKAEHKRLLQEILDRKKNEELLGLSVDQIQAKINELS